MTESTDASAHAELLREFVNTWDVEYGDDGEELTSPQALLTWLRTRDLVDPTAGADVTDLDSAIAIREGLRAMMVDHHDRGGDAPRPELERISAASPLVLSFGAGGPSLTPVARDVRGGLAAILAAVVGSKDDGTWPRLKVCGARCGSAGTGARLVPTAPAAAPTRAALTPPTP